MKISIILEALTGTFVTDMKRAASTVQKAMKDINTSAEAPIKAVAANVSAATVAIGKMTLSAIDNADALRDMSIQWGIGVETLSSFDLALRESGTSTETLARGLKALSAEAVGNAEALGALGIESKNLDGSVRDLDALLLDVADRFASYEDGAAKAALAQKLFGKAGVEMIPFLNQGREGIEALRDRARELGLVIDQDFADNADAFNDSLTELGGLARGFANDLAADLLPNLIAFNQELLDNATESGGATTAAEGFGDVLRFVASGLVLVQAGAEKAGAAVGFLVDVIAGQIDALKEIGSAYGTYLEEVVSEGPLDAIANFMGAYKDAHTEAFTESSRNMDVLLEQFDEIDARATDKLEALNTEFADTAAGAKKAGEETKKVPPPILTSAAAAEKAANSWEKFNEAAKKLAAEQAKARQEILDNVDAIKAQFDPIEEIDQAYDDMTATIRAAIGLRMEEGAQYDDLIELLGKLGDARRKEIKAVVDAQNPVEALITSLELEAQDRKLGAIELEREILLRQMNAKATDEEKAAIDALLKSRALDRAAGQYGAMFDSQGNAVGLDSLESLLGGIFDTVIKDGFESGVEVFRRGMTSAFKDAESTARTIADVAGFATFALQEFQNNPDAPLRALTNVAAQIPGIVGAVAQALQGIDALFGGRLLGTNYERDSAALDVRFGQSGFSGSTTVTDVRQRSLFRGRQWRDTVSELSGEVRDSLDDVFDAMSEALAAVARELGTEVGPLITGAFRQEFDKDGNVVREFSTIMGQTFNESLEEFQQRLTAENLLAVLERSLVPNLAKILSGDIGDGGGFGGGGGRGGGGGGLPGATMSEVQQIAQRWRASAEELLEGAQFLVLAQTAINDGNALLGDSLTETTDFVERLAQSGETLSETFARLLTAAELYEQALDMAGMTFDGTREQFVEFAAAIADAAGGIDRAAQLWQTYFETFFSAEERAQRAVDQASQTAGGMLSDLGLDPEIALADFRAQFEAALPTLSPEDVASWLEAGEALARLTAAEQALADIRGEAAQTAEELAAAQAAASAELSALLASLDATSLSEFGQDVADINAQMAALTDQANALAIEAGRAGASTEELATITAWAARQYEMAVDRLRDRVRSLTEQLYGTELDRIDAQISQMTSAAQDAERANAAAAAEQQRRYEQELGYIRSIREYVESLLLSDLSPLNPAQQFAEAQSQFETLLAAARGGDVNALGQLQGAAQALLTQGQSFFGPNDQFTALFEAVTGALSSLGVTSQPGGGPAVTLVPSDELNALFARREELLMEQEERNRLALAEALAEQIGELSRATGESALTLIDSIDQLVADLGISLEELTVSTAVELADLARTLNLSVADLAEAVGVSLGELNETSSLINDAFEQSISELPAQIQDELWPLLRAVENAVDEADANGAITNLRDAVDELAPDLRDELAPYLGLGQAIEQPLIDLQTRLGTLGDRQVSLLTSIDAGIQRLAPLPAPVAPEAPPASAMGVTYERGQDRSNEAVLAALDRIAKAVIEGDRQMAMAVSDSIAKLNRGR